MRQIENKLIKEEVKKLALEANYDVGCAFFAHLKGALQKEESPIGKQTIQQIIENDTIAKENKDPMCQDTGVVVVMLEIGQQVQIDGDVYEAVNQGVKEAYEEGYFRKSVVRHPLDRVNTKDNTPAITHIRLVPGDKIKITVAPKGGGSENMSLVKMLIPSDGVEGIKRLVLDTVTYAEGKPCPPIIIGIGLGGNLEKSALLAKEALFRDIDDINPDPILEQLEKEILKDVNKLGIGPMGFGGKTTALAVKIAAYPCHIASLPVAINLQCHASRHKHSII